MGKPRGSPLAAMVFADGWEAPGRVERSNLGDLFINQVEPNGSDYFS